MGGRTERSPSGGPAGSKRTCHREALRRGPAAGTLTHASEGQRAEREVHDHVVGRDTPAGRAVNHPPDELRDRARLGQRFRLHAGVGAPRFTSNGTRGAPALLKHEPEQGEAPAQGRQQMRPH